MAADALSTALTVLGADAGMAFARERDVAALFLVRDAAGTAEHMTPAFAPMLAHINTIIEGWNSAAQAHLRYKRALVEDPILAGMLKKQMEIEGELRDYQRRAASAAADASGITSGLIDPQAEAILKSLYPQGTITRYSSKVDPSKDFMIFFAEK